MSVVCTGTVAQNNATGTQLLFTDTGTGYGAIISRTLLVYDANGILLTPVPINMGSVLTATLNIIVDQWLSFVLTVIDNTGTYTCTVNFLAEGIYAFAFLNKMVGLGCGCKSHPFCNLFKAELSVVAAERFAISGLGVSATSMVTAANIYVNAQ